MKYKNFAIPLYSGRLHVIYSEDCEKELEEINKKFDIGIEKPSFMGFAQRTGKHYLVLLNLKYIRSEYDLAATVAHEAFHVSNFILKQVGIKPDVDNDESQAYLISWIVEQVFKTNKL